MRKKFEATRGRIACVISKGAKGKGMQPSNRYDHGTDIYTKNWGHTTRCWICTKMRPYFMRGSGSCWIKRGTSSSCIFRISRLGSTHNLCVSFTTKISGSNAPLRAHVKIRPWGWLYNQSFRLCLFGCAGEINAYTPGDRVSCILGQLGRACPAEHEYSTVSFNQKKHGSLREKSKDRPSHINRQVVTFIAIAQYEHWTLNRWSFEVNLWDHMTKSVEYKTAWQEILE